MASSSSVADQVWEMTSTPRLLHYSKDGKYRLSLKYAPAKGKKPIRKTSQEFATELEARASRLPWRLSWEQGRGGTHPNHGASQETLEVDVSGSSSSAVPLQGELKVMCAVMHLHDRGVIHKDIKPGNILVHGDGRLLLADFDVSKDTSGPPGGPPLLNSVISDPSVGGMSGTALGGGNGGGAEGGVDSGAGRHHPHVSPGGGEGDRNLDGLRYVGEAETTRTSFAGTQGFMAPEVEAGHPSSRASDMYSLGAVLFHMYFPDHPTGPLPVGNGRTSTGVGVVGVPLALPREMDHATASLLRALLAADPAERPTAPDALQADYFRVSHVERLQEDGSLLEQARKLEAVRALFRSVRDEAKSAGPLKWTVRRDSRYLVPMILELVTSEAAGPALRRNLKITFEGEAGVDEGGILSEMYTLLFEAMMLPRFGLFEHSESPPAPSPPSCTTGSSTLAAAASPRSDGSPSSGASALPGSGDRGQGSWRDPTERAFARRYRGVAGRSASDGNGPSQGNGGNNSADNSDIAAAGGDHVTSLGDAFASREQRVDRDSDDDDTEEEGTGEGDDDFGVQQEAQRMMIESAAGGGGGSSEEGGLSGSESRAKSGSKFLPTARPHGYSEAQLGRYRAIGRIMVKCLLEGRRIGSRLAPSVFKFLTGTEPTLRDLQDYDSQTFEGLKWLLTNTGTRDMGLHFEEVGTPEKGDVTDGNKSEYVAAKARLILVGSREAALEALKGGFAGALRDLSPGAAPLLGLLSHADWRVLICGEEHVSGAQVVAVLKWSGFPARSQVPEWIRSLLLSLPEDALRRFLIFVCGTPSLPAPSAGKVEISVRCQLRSAALPTAHTCFFQLDVPDYDKEAVLRHKLLQAVNNTASFDVV